MGKYVETPELMLTYFEEYCKDIKNKPFLVKDWVGKDGIEVNREKEKPLTMIGFENYLYRKGVINDLKDYFANTDKAYQNYQDVCRYIQSCIREDQIGGGMANIYNANITARINGLSDKNETTIVEQPLFPDKKEGE